MHSLCLQGLQKADSFGWLECRVILTSDYDTLPPRSDHQQWFTSSTHTETSLCPICHIETCNTRFDQVRSARRAQLQYNLHPNRYWWVPGSIGLWDLWYQFISHSIHLTFDGSGNAHTDMAVGHTQGALQPNGSLLPEETFDVKHVADAIVHIAALPLDVTVLNMNIMWASSWCRVWGYYLPFWTGPFVGRGWRVGFRPWWK